MIVGLIWLLSLKVMIIVMLYLVQIVISIRFFRKM